MTIGELRGRVKNSINFMGNAIYPVVMFLVVMSLMLVQFTILLWPYSGYMLIVACAFFYVVGRVRKWAETDENNEGTL